MPGLLAQLVGVVLAIGLVGLAVQFAGSSRTRWVVLLGPALIAATGLMWHKLAVRYFSGDTFLTYGYFETQQGAIARPWVITVPWIGVLVALLAFAIVITTVCGLKRSDAASITSWIWSLLVFVVFSLYIIIASIQGDASVFI